jgi:hypothetical protein
MKHLKDFTSQREYYWLSVDQILPKPGPFRQRLDLDLDWKRVDNLKLFASSSMQAFMWRSTHGKLYGQSELFRFNYVMEPDCHFCGHQKQNIVHVFTKEVGMDTDKDRKKILLKRLNILRKYIYSCIHAKAMPKWEEVLYQIDQAYVLEYAIADKAGAVHKVLREWDL